jgi:hypothetical protein
MIRQHAIPLATVDSISIRLAESFVDRCRAWNLVYTNYVQSGFTSSHPAELYFSLLDLLPCSFSWIAESQSRTYATMSLVINSTCGLPAGPQYEPDLNRAGVDGKTIAELTKLAVDQTYPASAALSLQMMATLLCWCKNSFIDDAICVVHPRHAKSWIGLFGFKVLGETQPHQGVSGSPGILLHLDLRRMSTHYTSVPARGRVLLKQAQERFRRPERIFRLSGCEVFTALIQRSDILLKASAYHRSGLYRHFPWASNLLHFALGEGRLGMNRIESYPSPRPDRERPFLFPNYLSRLRSTTDRHNPLMLDQLLFPDAPLILFLCSNPAESENYRAVLEDAGVVAVGATTSDHAIDLLRGHLFDSVFIDARESLVITRDVTRCVRERDSSFGIHTPIVHFGLSPWLLSNVGASGTVHHAQVAAFMKHFCATLLLAGEVSECANLDQLLVEDSTPAANG